MNHKLDGNGAAVKPAPAVTDLTEAGTAEFKISRRRILAGVVAGTLLGLAGLAVLAVGLGSGGDWPWHLAAVALVLAGGGVLALMKLLAALRIWVSPQGFVVATLGPGRAGHCFRIEALEPAEAERRPVAARAGQVATCWSRGLAFSAQGEYEKALAELNEAIRLDPNLTAAYHARAAVHAYRGAYDQALADYAAARQLQARGKAG
jgi:tetratricopeptide (TPR) repeat protein